MTTTDPASHTDETDLRYLRRSFVRHLAADRRSTATRAAYSAAVGQMLGHYRSHAIAGRPRPEWLRLGDRL
jgi:hypothetical protein